MDKSLRGEQKKVTWRFSLPDDHPWHMFCGSHYKILMVMKIMKKLLAGTGMIALLFLLMQTQGCEEYPYDPQEVIFESHYINHAWGYQNSGFIIDSEGNLRTFNLPEEWNHPDSEGYISREAMEQNLACLGEATCTVSRYDMNYYAEKLFRARDGKITDPEHTAYDAGVRTFGGYLYEPLKNRYRYVFIYQWGDFTRENTAREAEMIREWMMDPCEGGMNLHMP